MNLVLFLWLKFDTLWVPVNLTGKFSNNWIKNFEIQFTLIPKTD